MKRLLVATLVAVAATPLAAAGAAAADPVNMAGWNKDRAGDQRSYHRAGYPQAPRRSVDIRRDRAFPKVDKDGVHGFGALAKLANVRTAKQSTVFHQQFSVTVTTTLGRQTFGLTRGTKVRDLATGRVCRGAEGSFDSRTEQVTLFVPGSCLDGAATVRAVRARTALLDPEGLVLATDGGTRVRG